MAIATVPLTRHNAPAAASSWVRWWKRWWWVGLLTLGGIYLPGWITLQRLAMRRSQLAQELAQTAQENQRLAEERRQLLTNPSYVEAVARRQLRATRKGETVLKIEPQPMTKAADPSAKRVKR